MYQYFRNQEYPKKGNFKAVIHQYRESDDLSREAQNIFREAENIFCWRVRRSGGHLAESYPNGIVEWHILGDKK